MLRRCRAAFGFHTRCLACLALVFVGEAAAEARVSYGTVALTVDSVRPAGPNLVAIQVNGEGFLVAEEDAGRRVALRLLASSESQVTPELASTLAEQAARVSDTEVLQGVVQVIINNQEWIEFDSEGAWTQVVETEAGRKILPQVIEANLGVIKPTRLCAILNALHQRSLVARELARNHAELCINQALGRAFDHVYTGHDVQEAIGIIEAAREVYSPSGMLANDPARVVATLQDLNDSVTKVDVDAFGATLSALRAQRVGLNRDPATVSPAHIVERFMQEAVKAGSYGAALKVLSLIEFEKRTPAVHQYILVALDGLQADEAVKIFSPELHGMMGQFAVKDDQIAKHYALMVERCVSILTEGGHVGEARTLLYNARGLEVTLRDMLRGSAELLAARLFNARDVAGANQILEAFVSTPSSSIRLRRWLASFGLTINWAFVLLGAALVCGLTLGRRQHVKRVEADKRKSETIRKSASNVQPPSVEEKGKQYSPEYIEALKVFGLGVEVTLPEIKNAYRQAVKEHHPDAKLNPTAADNDYFITLTTAYERLLKLHDQEGKHAAS